MLVLNTYFTSKILKYTSNSLPIPCFSNVQNVEWFDDCFNFQSDPEILKVMSKWKCNSRETNDNTSIFYNRVPNAAGWVVFMVFDIYRE
jgi:hypothetical protein